MADRILHFGSDDCNRVIVLRRAGYSVDACLTLPHLHSAFNGDGEFAAVVMSEAHELVRRDALTLVRSRSSAPVILFEHTNYCPDEAAFDLVIRNLTPVREWLDSIAATIEFSRALCAQSKVIRERSSALLQEVAATREESNEIRQRSARIRAESREIRDSAAEKSFTGSKNH